MTPFDTREILSLTGHKDFRIHHLSRLCSLWCQGLPSIMALEPPKCSNWGGGRRGHGKFTVPRLEKTVFIWEP